MKLSTLSASGLAWLACCAAPVHAEPALVSGLDVTSFDTSVRVQDDFYRYVNGIWAQSTQIPADKSTWGTYSELRETAQQQVRVIIADTVKHPGPVGSESQKIADFYANFVDQPTRTKLGFKPLRAELDRIAALTSKEGLPALIASLNRSGIAAPFSLGVYQDARDARQYAVYLSQSGLGMPDRDYYLKDDDAKLTDARLLYVKHMATMLGMAGDKNEYTGAGGLKLFLWPGSGVFATKPKWIVAGELVETTKQYARTVAAIQPQWIEQLASHLVKRNHSDPHWSSKSGAAFCYELRLNQLSIGSLGDWKSYSRHCSIVGELRKPLRISHRARKSGRMGCTEMHNPFSVKNIECVIDQGATARTEKATIASNQTQAAHFYTSFPISQRSRCELCLMRNNSTKASSNWPPRLTPCSGANQTRPPTRLRASRTVTLQPAAYIGSKDGKGAR